MHPHSPRKSYGKRKRSPPPLPPRPPKPHHQQKLNKFGMRRRRSQLDDDEDDNELELQIVIPETPPRQIPNPQEAIYNVPSPDSALNQWNLSPVSTEPPPRRRRIGESPFAPIPETPPRQEIPDLLAPAWDTLSPRQGSPNAVFDFPWESVPATPPHLQGRPVVQPDLFQPIPGITLADLWPAEPLRRRRPRSRSPSPNNRRTRSRTIFGRSHKKSHKKRTVIFRTISGSITNPVVRYARFGSNTPPRPQRTSPQRSPQRTPPQRTPQRTPVVQQYETPPHVPTRRSPPPRPQRQPIQFQIQQSIRRNIAQRPPPRSPRSPMVQRGSRLPPSMSPSKRSRRRWR